MNVWQESRAYIQADSDFEGGNNQTLGVKGMSGIYLKEIHRRQMRRLIPVW